PTAEQTEIEKIICGPDLQIKIPGLHFSSAQEVADRYTVQEDDGTYVYIPFLGQYIAGVYKWSIGAISIIAIIMIIVSGIQWMMPGNVITSVLTKAGGEKQEESINKAKKRIVGALTGLLLAIGSYTILYAINPELVQFKYLKVKYIEGKNLDQLNESVLPADFVFPPGNYNYSAVELDGQAADTTSFDAWEASDGCTSTPNTGCGIVYGYNNVPYYAQYGRPWGTQQFGLLPICLDVNDDDGDGNYSEHSGDDNLRGDTCCTDIAHGGCNVTSYAMVLRALGKPVDPEDTAKVAVQSGARECNSGITGGLSAFHEAIENTWPDIVIERFGNGDASEILEKLKQGQLIITRGRQEGFTSTGHDQSYGGHYMVLTGADDQWVYVNDPGNRRPTVGITHMSHAQFLAKNDFIWIHLR
ncbi:C39 family peptidase, partial [Patescibacteria group bacterium]|nr:C39 family peptidase [Patescibacteria group bacterium]